MKKILSLFLALSMLFALSACGGGGEQSSPSPSAEPSPSQSEPVPSPSQPSETPQERVVTVTDMSGDEVTITGEVSRILNLWPSVTTSLYVLGAGDLISGLATMGTNGWSPFFYPGCVDIPTMGGTTPAVEDIAAQDPDLVIVHPTSVSSGLPQQIRDLGIPAINISCGNYEDMIQAYGILGQALGGEYEEKLETWCGQVQEKIDAHRALTADLAEEDRPVVYYIAGQADDLLTTMGEGQIMQDWIESNGGIFASTMMEVTGNGLQGSNVTAEEVFRVNPDVIIVGGAYQHVLMDELQNTDGWKDLDAVKNGRVYNNPYGCWNWDRYGMESLLQLDYALLCIQPDLAAQEGITRESMTQEVIDFYQFYNGTELTQEQAGYMMDGYLWDGSTGLESEGE